jgi:hypothetical protein
MGFEEPLIPPAAFENRKCNSNLLMADILLRSDDTGHLTLRSSDSKRTTVSHNAKRFLAGQWLTPVALAQVVGPEFKFQHWKRKHFLGLA